jgi:hypothetical protein
MRPASIQMYPNAYMHFYGDHRVKSNENVTEGSVKSTVASFVNVTGAGLPPFLVPYAYAIDAIRSDCSTVCA